MNTDLDVAAPEQVSAILRAAAQKYLESSADLASAWRAFPEY
jgi:hypothetical protein